MERPSPAARGDLVTVHEWTQSVLLAALTAAAAVGISVFGM